MRFLRSLVATVSLLAFAFPAPTLALNVHFSCWCQDTETRMCSHHLIDTGIAEGSSELTTAGIAVSPISIAGASVLMIVGETEREVENLLNIPALAGRFEALRTTCRERCAADGGKRAFHYETEYREEICEECNAGAGSSCTEERGARLAFGDEKVQELVAKCEERKAASLFPIKLGTPIGGVSEVQGLPDYINVVYRYLTTVVLVAAIVMVVWGGFRYLLGSSVGEIGRGKEIIKDALIGMLIVLGAYTILSTINPATTILSFQPPEPVECSDLKLPQAVKNARCTTDSQCGPGKRCVEGRNLVFSVGAVAEANVKGQEGGAAAGKAFEESGGVSKSFIGAGTAAGTFLNVSTGGLYYGLLAADAGVTEVGGYEFAGGQLGSNVGTASETINQYQRARTNLRLCSTGEQGSPCTEDRYCKAPLKCVIGWGLCWPDSGNAPGMPCNEPANCSNNNCEEVVEDTGFDIVVGTKRELESLVRKVCHIDVRDGTPCLRPNNGTSATVFPILCQGPPVDSSFTCAWCPSGQAGEARVWTYLNPGDGKVAQCKPRTVLGQPCAR